MQLLRGPSNSANLNSTVLAWSMDLGGQRGAHALSPPPEARLLRWAAVDRPRAECRQQTIRGV